MLKKNFLKILIISLIFIGLTFSLTVKAITAGGIGIRPAYPDPENSLTRAWFIYDLESGESKEDVAIVTNYYDEEITIWIYAVDSKLSNDGSFALAMPDEEKKDVGAWVRFLKEEEKLIEGEKKIETEEVEEMKISLGSKEEKEVKFVITIPEDADVGEHSGGIVIQGRPKEEKAEGGVAIVTRLGARIYETVPGEIIRKIALTRFGVSLQEEKYLINFSLKNEGNVSLTPEVRISVNDLLFHNRDQVFQRTPQVSRGAEIGGSFEWEKPKWKMFTYPGKFSFQAQVSYLKNGELEIIKSEPIYFWIIPWLEISILAGIILILLIVFGVKLLLVKREKKKMKEYEVKTGETIETIAEKFGMKWKKLAKINQLKPPYTLKPGQKIGILEKK